MNCKRSTMPRVYWKGQQRRNKVQPSEKRGEDHTYIYQRRRIISLPYRFRSRSVVYLQVARSLRRVYKSAFRESCCFSANLTAEKVRPSRQDSDNVSKVSFFSVFLLTFPPSSFPFHPFFHPKSFHFSTSFSQFLFFLNFKHVSLLIAHIPLLKIANTKGFC